MTILDRMIESRGFLVPEVSVPSKGSLPHNIENKITPNDQTSNGGPVRTDK